MTAANPTAFDPWNTRLSQAQRLEGALKRIRALETENIRLGNENRVLHGDRNALRTENAALKIEIADAVARAEDAEHDRDINDHQKARVVKFEHHHATKHELCEFKEAPR
jgi:hypothetical protein